ncbi:unnamed protein product, partial [Musa acuminata var. zebrina]
LFSPLPLPTSPSATGPPLINRNARQVDVQNYRGHYRVQEQKHSEVTRSNSLMAIGYDAVRNINYLSTLEPSEWHGTR